jgi:hypothetical protein
MVCFLTGVIHEILCRGLYGWGRNCATIGHASFS